MRQAIYSKLKERQGTFTHSNSDPLYTPARWWYDQYNTALGGYILQTRGDISINEVNDKLVLEIWLEYEKTPR